MKENNNKEYYIMLDGRKVFVTEDVFKAYKKVTNHEEYQYTRERELGIYTFSDFKKEEKDR